MSLIDRITRLFRADINDILDRIEEPRAILRQAVRDMEQSVSQDQESLRRLEGEHERLATRLSELETARDEIVAHLDVCFESGREDLARQFIKRRLEIENLDKHLCREKGLLEDRLVKLKKRFQARQRHLEEISKKADALGSETTAETFGADPGISPDAVIRDEDVEVALLMEKQIRSRP